MLNEKKSVSNYAVSRLIASVWGIILGIFGVLAVMIVAENFPGRPYEFKSDDFIRFMEFMHIPRVKIQTYSMFQFWIFVAVVAELFLIINWGKVVRVAIYNGVDELRTKKTCRLLTFIYYLAGFLIVAGTVVGGYFWFAAKFEGKDVLFNIVDLAKALIPFCTVAFGVPIVIGLTYKLLNGVSKSYYAVAYNDINGTASKSKMRASTFLTLLITALVITVSYYGAVGMDLENKFRFTFMNSDSFIQFQNNWGFHPIADAKMSAWTVFAFLLTILSVYLAFILLAKVIKQAAVNKSTEHGIDVREANSRFDKVYSVFAISVVFLLTLTFFIIFSTVFAMNPGKYAFEFEELFAISGAFLAVFGVCVFVLLVILSIFKILNYSLKAIQVNAAASAIDNGVERICEFFTVQEEEPQEETADESIGGDGTDGIMVGDEPLRVILEEKEEEPIEEEELQEEEEEPVVEIETYFPSLIEIDQKYENGTADIVAREDTDIRLDELVLRFHSYLCNDHKIFFEVPIVRAFISALGCARLVILEGLSGTGKTTLPRIFSYFTSTPNNVCAVQSTWRDRTDVIGYYNDFANNYRETKFLKALYEASYTPELPQLLVIDEMNLSRVEYYFADFLSVLEYPEDQWKIELMPHIDCKDIPKHIKDGQVMIPHNVWILGTGNKDDSTFAITDKVYDRAFVIDFDARNREVYSDYNHDPLPISTDKLYELFNEAKANPEYCLNAEDMYKFNHICDVTAKELEIVFGNRIMTQIHKFVPIYVAAGGSKEEALDIIFARKVLRKLEGKFDDFIRDGLFKLHNEINKTYGKNVFVDTERAIMKLKKKLI